MISAIVAVRNAEAVLHMTLQSLKQQSWQDFEVILIDGASTDNTLTIAEEFKKHIDVQISEPDAGIADAWNKGLRSATGKWITFLNAGDLLHQDHFARAAEKMKMHDGQPAILFCDVLKFDKHMAQTVKIVGSAPTLSGIRRGSIGFAHPGSFSSSICFEKIGLFDTNLRIAIDTDWLLRSVKAGILFDKFASCAYMAEGGISDRKFGEAMREYFGRAHHWGFTTERSLTFAPLMLSTARNVLHVYRRVFRGLLRTVKHALVVLLNMVPQLLPFFTMRRLYFNLIGIELAQGASIGMGFRFYRTRNICIGKNSVVNRDCLFDNRDVIKIGKNVSVARNVRIFTAGHDPESPLFEMTTSPVAIGDHVVIFAGAMIMPGVSIGRGAIVHSGAVVTKDVSELSIVGGVPAKEIGTRQLDPSYALNYPYPTAM